jgi:hypothetical protein
MLDDLVRELQAQQTEEPNYVSELTRRAAQEILRLRGEVTRMHSDRQYIIGFNDGFEAAVEQSEPQPLKIVEPH